MKTPRLSEFNKKQNYSLVVKVTIGNQIDTRITVQAGLDTTCLDLIKQLQQPTKDIYLL